MSYEFKEHLCVEELAKCGVLVIFGASGDLTKHKLIIALYKLFRNKLIDKDSMIIACARKRYDDNSFRKYVSEIIKSSKFCHDDFDDNFLKLFHYLEFDYSDSESYIKLSNYLANLNVFSHNLYINYYLATPPFLYLTIANNLAKANLLKEKSKKAWRHVVFEKPFGCDLHSAMELDKELAKVLKEEQIYRIDHYLGKSTIQNIFMLRFANIIFEEIWNCKYIEQVQITVYEQNGIGSRAEYFDKAGLLRDMFQNHLLAILSIISMETPVSFEANFIRDEKVKVIKSIRPFDKKHLQKSFVFAQYDSYLNEKNVKLNSQTETFIANKIYIDNWRWQNVPFYLRCGKKMDKNSSEILIIFKKIPYSIFKPLTSDDLLPNILQIKINENESMSLYLQGKKNGPRLCIGSMNLHFDYKDNSLLNCNNIPLDAYARLLHDIQLGDQTLFLRSDVIHESWRLFDYVLKAYDKGELSLYKYADGSSKIMEADKILELNHSWIDL